MARRATWWPVLFVLGCQPDDARSAVEKVDYARREGLGGVMIWELAGGHRASLPRPERQALLTAIGDAAR